MLRIEYWINIDFLLNHQSLIAFCISAYLWLLYDVCMYMFIPCSAEILFLISCQLGPLEAYKKMLNRNLIVWKDWNPVSWTSKAKCPFWMQPSIESSLWNSYQKERHASVGLLFTRLVLRSVGICWNVDTIPGNDGSLLLEWSRKLPTVFVSRTSAVSCRRRRELWQTDG